jgi:hypothetical protein
MRQPAARATAGPTAAEGGPEESIQGIQNGPLSFPFKYGDLLAEGEDLKGGITPTTDEVSHDGDE